MSSDICLQARYDLDIMFKMKINRNRPLVLGRGRGTKISDTKCSREQVKVSMLVPEKRRIGKKTDPLCLEIQPTHRFLTVHYHEGDSLEEIKKEFPHIFQEILQFCNAESLNDVLDEIERKLEPHLVDSEPKSKPNTKTTSKANNTNNAITDTTIKIKLVSPNPTRISERLGKQKINPNKTFDVPPIIITSRENSGSDDDFIDTINDAEPPAPTSFLNAVKTNISNSKKKVVHNNNNNNPKKTHENFDIQKSIKSNKSKYTEDSGEERDEGDDDSSYGHIHSEDDEESIEGNDKIDIDTYNDKQIAPSNKRKTTQTKSKNAKRVRS